jgi:hypothetical protein
LVHCPTNKTSLTGAITISDVGGTDDVTLIQFTETNNYDQFSIRGDFAGAGGENKLKFSTDLGGGDILTMKGDGNVGIGTTSPGKKLEVREVSNTESSIRIRQLSYNYWDLKSPASDTGFTISDVGGEKLRITSTGNVGIGITNPATYDSNADNLVIGSVGVNDKNGITIVGGDTDGRGAIYFADTTQNSAGYITYKHVNDSMLFGTSDSTALTIDSSGNVGIGTTSPSYKLHVSGKGLFNAGSIGSNINDTKFHLEVAGARHHLDFKEVRTAQGVTDWKNTTFKLQMRVDSTNHQSIDFVSDSSYAEHIDIYTGNQLFNTRFDANGNVGIGTTSPNSKLEVRKATATHQLVSLNRPDSDVAAMYLGNDSSSPANGVIASNYSDLILGRDQSGTLTEHVRIKRDGNVGIGTDSPSEKLDVIGFIRVHDGVDNGRILFRGDRNDVYIKELSYGLLFGAPSGLFFETDTNNNGNAPFNITKQGSSSFYINDSQNVGIGTTSPGAKLEVNGDGTNTGGIALREGTNQVHYIYTDGPYQYNNIGSSSPNWRWGQQGADTKMALNNTGLGIGTTSPSQKLEVAGHAYINNGSNSNVYLETTDNWIYGDINGVGIFNANNNLRLYTVGLERLRINSSGNVGIGTTSPSYKLDVDATSIRPTANLLLGEAAYSVSGSYVGLKTTFMSGSNDYMILSGKSDGSTYVVILLFKTEQESTLSSLLLEHLYIRNRFQNSQYERRTGC